jgi:hypothetical protein
VSNLCVFDSVAWDHIPYEKMKYFHPKSDKCIFVGYSEDVKWYILFQPHSDEIIIRRDVEFDENLLACEPNSTFVPSSACESFSTFVSFSLLVMVSSSSNDDSEDENPTPPTHLPPNESIEHESTTTPLLLKWVYSTREEVGDIVGDPSY